MANRMFHNRRGERVAMPTFTATDAKNEFDELLARMQTPGARQGMADAFNATPILLGRSAVAAAKKRG